MAALEAPELLADPRFATRMSRIEHYASLGAEIDARFQRRTTAEWVERLAAHDVPAAPIHTMAAAVEDPQARHLGLFVPTGASEGAAQAVRPAVQFDGERATRVRAAPRLGEHSGTIRAALAARDGWPAQEAG